MIRVEELRYTYPGASSPTINAMSFDVADQEIVGFLGPSGAGKSTTQKILIGLLKGYSGRVEVMGRAVADWGAGYYERIGVSFEMPNHYQRLTARENLEHFGALYASDTIDAVSALEMVDLGAHADQRVLEFSKGMKIRLNVARSLLHRPALLFLDEPTSGLDPVNAQRIIELVRRLREQGATIVLTTHDMHVADQLCDRVALITAGEIRELDAPSALKSRYGRRVVRVEYGQDGALSREFELDGLGEDQAFLTLLREAHVERIHSQETTLERVFIALTGQELKR